MLNKAMLMVWASRIKEKPVTITCGYYDGGGAVYDTYGWVSQSEGNYDPAPNMGSIDRIPYWDIGGERYTLTAILNESIEGRASVHFDKDITGAFPPIPTDRFPDPYSSMVLIFENGSSDFEQSRYFNNAVAETGSSFNLSDALGKAYKNNEPITITGFIPPPSGYIE